MSEAKRPLRRKDLSIPTTPMRRPGFRDVKYVRTVIMRMGTRFVDRLDELCKVNGRSRREIVEILIAEASVELRANPNARITPLSEH